NVITASGEDSATGADIQGADGAKVTGVAAGTPAGDQVGNVGVQISGTYGKLTLSDDGSYQYTRNTGSKGGVDDVFTYTLTDGDADKTTTPLPIHSGDSGVTVTPPAIGDASDTVYEKGLAPRGAEPAGSGEIADGLPNNNSDSSEKTSGTIAISAPDGVA